MRESELARRAIRRFLQRRDMRRGDDEAAASPMLTPPVTFKSRAGAGAAGA